MFFEGEEYKESVKRRQTWAAAMSEEMLEIMQDYKAYALNEHLFDGCDDLRRTQ